MSCNILKCTCGKTHYLPQRILVAIMSLMCILVGYGHRVSLSIAITAMTDHSASTSISCPLRNRSFSKKNISGGFINWSNTEQNLILSAFYPGYIIGHVPAGLLGDHFGARWILFTGMLLSTITAVMTPTVVANAPWWMTYITRSIMGLGQSVMYPCISVLYAKWIPKEERSVLGAFSFAANSLGVIFGNLFTGLLIDLVGNWRIGFYAWGILGGIWCTFVIIYIFSEPDKHPFITEREKTKLNSIPKSDKTLKIPWRGFFSDNGIWALVVVQIGHDFTIFTLVNNFPKYLSDVLHYDLAENAMSSSLPYLGQWLGGIIAGKILDYCIKRKGMSILLGRRITTTLGMVLPAAFILAAGYMRCNGKLVICMFGANLFFKGMVYCGMKINHLDMSVNFAGILMALINGIGAFAGWASPMIINVIAPDNTLDQWRIVFWVVFGFALITNVYYVIFAKADRRKWDVGDHEMDAYLKAKEDEKAANAKKREAKKVAKEAKKEDKGPSTA